MQKKSSKCLESFPNPSKKNYLIEFECPEFTCVCPRTGQPDFGTIEISYIPKKSCVELKSLKLYLWSFRNEGHFHEAVTNQICDDLFKLLKPTYVKVVGDFYIRGGIKTIITAAHGKLPRDVEPTLF